MKTSSAKFIALFITLLLTSSAYAAIGANDWLDKIKQQFINVASVNIEDYRLCEIYSKKENKKEFAERVFPKNTTQGMKDIQWKEMNFYEEAAKSGLHLGIVVIQYVSEESASNAVYKINNNAANYLAGSHILTKYIALRREDKVAFIYSETFIDDRLKQFFSELVDKQVLEK